jgi:hypothetical protein
MKLSCNNLYLNFNIWYCTYVCWLCSRFIENRSSWSWRRTRPQSGSVTSSMLKSGLTLLPARFGAMLGPDLGSPPSLMLIPTGRFEQEMGEVGLGFMVFPWKQRRRNGEAQHCSPVHAHTVWAKNKKKHKVRLGFLQNMHTESERTRRR